MSKKLSGQLRIQESKEAFIDKLYENLRLRKAEPRIPYDNSNKDHLDSNLPRAALDGYAVDISFDSFDKLYYVRIVGEPALAVAGHGDTLQEALDCLSVSLALILEDQPDLKKNYSGQINFRMSPDLHRQVAIVSGRQNLSINQFILSAVAEKIGRVA